MVKILTTQEYKNKEANLKNKGKVLQQTSPQRIYTNEREEHEKLFNFLSHQGIANPNRRYHFTPTGWFLAQRTVNSKCYGRVEKPHLPDTGKHNTVQRVRPSSSTPGYKTEGNETHVHVLGCS